MSTFGTVRLAPVVVAILLVGCGHPARPVVVSGAPAPVISQNGSEAAVNRTLAVQSAAKLKVLFSSAINPDCTPIAHDNVRAVKLPVHGTLSIKPAEDFV